MSLIHPQRHRVCQKKQTCADVTISAYSLRVTRVHTEWVINEESFNLNDGRAWVALALITHTLHQDMSGYKNFAVIGAGATGSYLVRQFLKDKTAGTVNQVVVLTRQVSLYNHD